MPQYSNSFLLQDGGTVNAVFNTESNTVTYNVTTPQGQTATLTLPPNADPRSVENLNNFRQQIRNQGGSPLTIVGFGQALQAVQNNTKEEASRAEATATATNTNVPDAPAPPPPVSPESNPAVPAVTSDPLPVNQEFIDINTEPQNAADLERLEAEINAPLSEPPGVPTDEFTGVDEAIVSNENRLQEPPQLTDEEAEQALRTFNEEFIENEEPPVIDINEEPYPVADLGELGINTDLPTEAALGELGINTDPAAGGSSRGLTGAQTNARTGATAQDEANFKQREDWRVRLSLAPSADYLYKSKQVQGILQPLAATDGIIFPYTPSIQLTYAASYTPTDLTHSNYKIFQYNYSSIDNLQITGDFTAQDTFEADYLLAVIHFLRSVTKMFYGQDQNPKPGTPPPLCYLSGLGAFQFDAHPLAVTSFTYSLPSDVDYIRAGSTTTLAGVNRSSGNTPINDNSITNNRLVGLQSGGQPIGPQYQTTPGGTVEPTYVPTKIQISIGCVPIISRNDISNRFSLKDYATGKLLRGSQNKQAGIW